MLLFIRRTSTNCELSWILQHARFRQKARHRIHRRQQEFWFCRRGLTNCSWSSRHSSNRTQVLTVPKFLHRDQCQKEWINQITYANSKFKCIDTVTWLSPSRSMPLAPKSALNPPAPSVSSGPSPSAKESAPTVWSWVRSLDMVSTSSRDKVPEVRVLTQYSGVSSSYSHNLAEFWAWASADWLHGHTHTQTHMHTPWPHELLADRPFLDLLNAVPCGHMEETIRETKKSKS